MRYSTSFAHYQNTTANDCGQVALATILDYWQLNPYHLIADQHGHYDNQELINCIKRDFPPNVLKGYLGTNFAQLKRALLHYGFNLDSGFGSKQKAQEKIVHSLTRQCPTLVCLNAGLIGGKAFTAHWSIIHTYNGVEISLTNWHLNSLPWELFLRAWGLNFIPLPSYHYSYLIPYLEG